MFENMYNNNNSSKGIIDNIDDSLGRAGNYLSESIKKVYNKVTGKPEQPTGLFGTSAPVGGKRRRKRGGYMANTPLNGIASNASPYNGVKTAQPHNWVGGKSRKSYRKNKNRRNKTRRMRR